jgi:hypothetical protein
MNAGMSKIPSSRVFHSPFTVLDVVGGRDVNKITQLDSAVTSSDFENVSTKLVARLISPTLIHGDFALFDIILTQTNEYGVLSTLAPN